MHVGGRGETGKRIGLKIQWLNSLTGSSPVAPTNTIFAEYTQPGRLSVPSAPQDLYRGDVVNTTGEADVAFEIVPDTEWRLADQIGVERKYRLINTDFDKILKLIESKIDTACFKKCRNKKIPDIFRAHFKIYLPCEVVVFFHNGAGGYRAQYYFGVYEGEKANRKAIDAMLGALGRKHQQQFFAECNQDFVKASLSDLGAKIWIHEGAWLTDNKPETRNLVVDRWKQNACRVNFWQY